MAQWNPEAIERYLAGVLGKPVSILSTTELGEVHDGGVKSYGYGTPVKIDLTTEGEAPRSLVLHTMSPGPFGHEHMSDRARILLWSHGAFNRLPQHVRSIDVGAFRCDGTLVSLGNSQEFCLLTEYADGAGYFHDLQRIRETDALTPLDRDRADALCDYLTGIHRNRGKDPGLYIRRVRELVGDGECIMGIVDSYPPHPQIPAELLKQIEHTCVEWRWKLKPMTHRLRQVHGDFHPWNILFGEGAQFRLLDRSRGEWGDPADDVACLTMNYVFFSLQRGGRLNGAFDELFRRFWNRYLDRTGDYEILSVVAPYFAFRALVMASPAWYPSLSDEVRAKLLAFVRVALGQDAFDPAEVNAYCGG